MSSDDSLAEKIDGLMHLLKSEDSGLAATLTVNEAKGVLTHFRTQAEEIERIQKQDQEVVKFLRECAGRPEASTDELPMLDWVRKRAKELLDQAGGE